MSGNGPAPTSAGVSPGPHGDWGQRLAVIAACLMLAPMVIYASSYATVGRWGRVDDIVRNFLLPAGLALALGILAKRAPAWAVLATTLAFAALWAWPLVRSGITPAEIFAVAPVSFTFRLLGLAAGITAFGVLRQEGRSRGARAGPLEGGIVGALGGLVLAWSQFKDIDLAMSLEVDPRAGADALLFAAPVGLAFAVVLASLGGARRIVLAATIAFCVVWVWGMIQFSGWFADYLLGDILGDIATLVGLSLGVLSYVLMREPEPGRAAPSGASPLALADGRMTMNPIAVLAALLVWVPFVDLIVGHLALVRAKRTGERGRAMALLALVLSYPWTILAAAYGLLVWSLSGLTF